MTVSIKMLASRDEMIRLRRYIHAYPMLPKHACDAVASAPQRIVSRNVAPLDMA